MTKFVCLFVSFYYSGSIYLPLANHTICGAPGLQLYRKIHYLTREFRVKLHAKTDIARISKR